MSEEPKYTEADIPALVERLRKMSYQISDLVNENKELRKGPDRVLAEVKQARYDQDVRWGEQNHPACAPHLKGVSRHVLRRHYGQKPAFLSRAVVNEAAKKGTLTWLDILIEEVSEAVEEGNQPFKLREELIQVAAVAVAMVESLDRNELKHLERVYDGTLPNNS